MNPRLIRLFVLPLLAAMGLLASQSFAQMGFGVSHVDVSSQSSVDRVAPGDRFVIAVVLDHDDHYHSHLHEPIIPAEMGDFTAIPTTIQPTETEGLSFGQIQWPTVHSVPVNFGFANGPVQYQVYSGKAIAYIPVLVDDQAEVGDRTIEIAVNFQACNDTTCDPPSRRSQSISFTVDPDAGSQITTHELFNGFDPSVFADAKAWGEGALDAVVTESTKPDRRFFGLSLPPIHSPLGVVVLALSAAIGGFVLNLTPCVLPVIPLKIMTISAHAGEKKSKAFKLGLSMAIGVVAFWTAIGIPVAFFASVTDPSIIFSYWWVTGGIGLMIALMSIGIMGLFQIKLPQSVYKVNPQADSVQGSFVFGMMTAVLGLPCFGFVAGALLAGSATMPPALVMTIFIFLGVGMALPYLVLAIFPKMVEKIPRTGPASELVKQVMGLLMLAAAAYFLGTSVIALGSEFQWTFPWWGKAVHWWVIGLMGMAAGLWLLVQTIRITKRVGPRLSFAVLGVVFALSGSAVAYNQTHHLHENYVHNIWMPYSEAALQTALASGNVVVLDFTAEWCLNCKTLEAVVLGKDPVKSLLLGDDVVPMVADVTGSTAPGWQKIKELDQVGIPLLAIFSPGQPDPIWMSNAYTSKQVAAAIRQAKGESQITLSDP